MDHENYWDGPQWLPAESATTERCPCKSISIGSDVSPTQKLWLNLEDPASLSNPILLLFVWDAFPLLGDVYPLNRLTSNSFGSNKT